MFVVLVSESEDEWANIVVWVDVEWEKKRNNIIYNIKETIVGLK